MNVKGILNAKLAGVPRWTWVALGTTTLLAVAYIRHRRMMAAEAGDPGVDESSSADPSLVSSIGSSGDPSLAGFGNVGAPAAGAVPVESPMIPVGYPETITKLTDILMGLAGTQAAIGHGGTVNKPGGVVVVRDLNAPTGGGPPSVGATAHRDPHTSPHDLNDPSAFLNDPRGAGRLSTTFPPTPWHGTVPGTKRPVMSRPRGPHKKGH